MADGDDDESCQNMNRHRDLFLIVARVFTVVVILGMTGGHWMILQSLAWTKMLADYSRNLSFQTALQYTFDGQHPCKMCKLIQKEKQASKTQPQLKRTVEDDETLFCECPAAAFSDRSCARLPVRQWAPGLRARDPPPVPPPRKLQVCA